MLPDGRIDLLFQLDQGAENACVVGPMRTFADVRYEAPSDLLGVRFQPGAAAAFLAPPADAMVDAVLGLDDLWSGVPGLVDQVASSPAALRIPVLATALERRLHPQGGHDRAALALERSHGALTVADLVSLTGTSERQLQRRFRERIGFPPRMARRIARFKAAVNALAADPRMPIPRLIHACGFYDQPHLNREFRAFAGTTPVEYAATRVGLVQDGHAESRHPESRERQRRAS